MSDPFANHNQIQANLANYQAQLQALIAANVTGITFTPAQTLELALAVNALIDLATGNLGSTAQT